MDAYEDMTPIPAVPDWVQALDDAADRREIAIDGTRVVWRSWGAGKPLLLLHGGHGSWRHWVRNIEPLSRHFRVHAADLPSFGESDALLTDNMHDYAALVAASADRLVDDAPVMAAGFSFGSMVGSVMSGLLSGGLERFAILGSPMLGEVHPVTGQLAKWRSVYEPEARLAAHGTNVGALMLTGPDSVTREAAILQMTHAEMASARMRGIFTRDAAAELLAEWDGPLTCIYGDRDALTWRHLDARKEKVLARGPDSEFHAIPGAGHWVQYQAAEAVNEILIRRLG